MDRLTYREEDGRVRLTKYGMQMYCSTQATADCFAKLEERLAAYEDTGLEPETLSEILDGVGEWYDAYKEDRLIVLPCKVGDTVYEPTNRGTISTYLVRGFSVEPFDSIWLKWDIQTGFAYRSIDGVNIDAIGKTVFLTREEAEAALGGANDA